MENLHTVYKRENRQRGPPHSLKKNSSTRSFVKKTKTQSTWKMSENYVCGKELVLEIYKS